MIIYIFLASYFISAPVITRTATLETSRSVEILKALSIYSLWTLPNKSFQVLKILLFSELKNVEKTKTKKLERWYLAKRKNNETALIFSHFFLPREFFHVHYFNNIKRQSTFYVSPFLHHLVRTSTLSQKFHTIISVFLHSNLSLYLNFWNEFLVFIKMYFFCGKCVLFMVEALSCG